MAVDARRIYSTDKLLWHPEVLESLRAAEITPPILVQLFPVNVCNQACGFCSYGSGPEAVRNKVPNPPRSLWKNQQLFHGRDGIPWEKCREIVWDCVNLGTKAIEITGGGEPLTYPHFDDLITQLQDTALDVALVTNGTLLTPARAKALGQTRLTWARVSIDAGSPEEYVRTRNVPRTHWEKAWHAVELLAAERQHGTETAIGVGFVLDQHNARSIYDAIRLAKEHGADNIRLSLSFTPDGQARWGDVLEQVKRDVAQAMLDFKGPGFAIYDLITERAHNVEAGRQTYPFCPWKEVGCVVGADQNVYACCSLAYNPLGKMGSIRQQSFAELWQGDGWRWRQQHDPRRDCRIWCLYEARNKTALGYMAETAEVTDTARAGRMRPAHLNFL